ncbi:MAG: proton-translocating transhydrogenase family protein [Paracoccaceae bacterium]|nr:proton-translocating transhydrogenase family protein [Paracoccaceae bacterium]
MSALDELRDAAERAAEATADLARIATEIAANAPEAADAAGHGAAAATGIDPFMFRLAIFALACFVGYYVVWSVTPALHTPLMSVTNAISSVIVVGALVAAGADLDAGATWTTRIFGFLGVILASVNIFGGFLVTERMLAMYKKKD